jgi:predicted histidine transporter YuiF (NhaC family)
LTFSETEQKGILWTVSFNLMLIIAILVSTTGSHTYASPAANQIRGPCPGLNAAANHNYLPRPT